MPNGKILMHHFLLSLSLQEKLNDTSELETRVQQLEEEFVTLQGDVEDQELYLEMTANQLLDDIRGLQSVDGDIQSRLEVLEAAIIGEITLQNIPYLSMNCLLPIYFFQNT